MASRTDLDSVFEHVRQTALLEATQTLLEWDERTGLPDEGGAYRAEQITQLSGMVHHRKIDCEYADRLSALHASIDSFGFSFAESSSIRRLHRDYERNRRLPTSLVQAISKATSLGQQAWERARHADDWPMFKPHLEEIVKLKREEAQLLSDGGSMYDALLDQYEMGARTGADITPQGSRTSTNLTEVFAKLRDGLRGLVAKLGDSKNPPTGQSWTRPVEVEKQKSISRWVAESIGYSFRRGRLDETTHPFCTTLGPNDCRILTRYQPDYFPSAFYGTLHEAGHGLYEQGLPTDWYGLPAGKYASLGVHESQSRLWENMVGRSEPFWRWALEKFAKQTGGAWDGLKPDDAFRDANLVKPSLIRVEADEATYNLHILIRFELEQRLVMGELTVADAPEAWNERYAHYLGVQPPSARDGILQDVHWSAGLIGYFPTYTLGNLYAAQLMQAAKQQLGDLSTLFRKGDFSPLLGWLRSNVHAHGASYKPDELIRNACGQPLDHQPLLEYLEAKLFEVYEI
jgi:carboxypeptidase Taq